MATFLGQTTHISLLIILLATTTLVHASKYRTFNAYTPSLHSNLPNNYNPFRRSPVFRQPYYTQSDPTPETYYPQPDPTPTEYYTQPNPTPAYYYPQPDPTPTKYYPQPDPPPTAPYTGGDSDKATFLAIHNAARASVGVPPMTWDDKVAAFAENWANQRINDCRLVHSGSEEYGENIFWGSGDYTAAFAVESWVSERKYYDVYSNSCSGGMDCGHWTQMVWRTSTRLGCARVKCSNGGVFVTCNYDPPRNYLGVRPY